MVSWDGLDRLGMRVRPIVTWPGLLRGPGYRVRSPFSAPFSVTVEDLTRELRQLRAREPFLQLAVREDDLRNDGFPKARAQLAHPGVVVTCRALAVKGQPQLSWACDRFWSWQDNLRGIAKGMEAQRLLKRYGIAEDDQQYRGYVALPQVSQMTAEEARALLVRFSDHEPGNGQPLPSSAKLFRSAAKRAQHIGEGEMNAVMNAGRVLGVVD